MRLSASLTLYPDIIRNFYNSDLFNNQFLIEKRIVMKHLKKAQKAEALKDDKKMFDEKNISQIQKQEKMFTMGIYALIIIITIALMLILFNVLLKV